MRKTLEQLRQEVFGSGPTDEYKAKMLHKVPDAQAIDREGFLRKEVKEKRVLNIGCSSGELHGQFRQLANKVYGVDKEAPADFIVDLDKNPDALPDVDVDVVVCGEVIEHLANPGRFLEALRKYRTAEIIITAPNAFCDGANKTMAVRGMENVNLDHVAWYSWRTLTTLFQRYRYKTEAFYWYRGKPNLAEGLIFVLTVLP